MTASPEPRDPGTALVIQLLGPTTLLLDGRPLPLPDRRVRALLAYLVLEGGWVSRDRLCAWLWPEAPREKARLSLRVALSRLRTLLPGRLDVRDDRLSFVAQPDDEVDVLALLGCSADGTDTGALIRAASLCRGPLSDDLSSLDQPEIGAWLADWRLRLDERLRAILLRLAQETTVQDPAAAIAYLRRAVAIAPSHEPTTAALMLSLARAGEHTAALTQALRLQEAMADDFGVEPSGELLALRERIAAARARGVQAALPSPPTAFVGREAELAAAMAYLARPDQRLLNIVGPGGIGKTRLAIEVARRVTQRFLDGVSFIALAGLAPTDGVAPGIAAALGLQLIGSSAPLDQVLEALRLREVLLVLDNFESIAGQAHEVAQLLAAGEGVRILVTSRSPLDLPGEQVLALDGLTYPDPLEAATFPAQHDAVALFVAAARRVKPDFAIDSQWAAIGAICHRVQGFPLALELAATWVADHDCLEIASRLEDDLAALPGTRGLPARHASLEAVFEHAWTYVNGEERLAFARLCVCRGGFDRVAAEALGVGPERLSALQRRSLVTTNGSDRFLIHEVLRHFGAQRLAQVPLMAERAHDAHAHHFASRFALAIRSHGTDAAAVVTLVDRDSDNLQAAWRHLVARGDGPALAPVAVDLVTHYYAQGPSLLGMALCDAIIDARPDASPGAPSPGLAALSARLLAERGFFRLRSGDRDGAAEAAEAARALAETRRADIGSTAAHEALAVSLRLRGILDRDAGDLDRATAALDASLRHAERAGARRLAAEAAYQRAGIAVYRGDLAQSIEATRAVLKEIQGHGYLRLECALHYTLAVLLDRTGAVEAAAASSQACLALATEMGYRLGEMNAAAIVGGIAYRRGLLADALAHLQRSVRLAQDLGHRATENSARLLAAMALVDLGRPVEAAYHLDRVLERTRIDGATRTEAGALLRRAYLQRAVHNNAAGLASAEQALATFQALGDNAHAALARAEIGRFLGRLGNVDEALRVLDEAIESLLAVGERTQWLSARVDRARLATPDRSVQARLAEATAARDEAVAAGIGGLAGPADILRGRLLTHTDLPAAAAILTQARDTYLQAGLTHRALDAAAALARCWWLAGQHVEARELAEAQVAAVHRYRLVGLESPEDTLADLLAVLEATQSPLAGVLAQWSQRRHRELRDEVVGTSLSDGHSGRIG